MSVAAGQDAACLPVFQATWVILLSSVAGHQKRHCAGGKAAVRESLGHFSEDLTGNIQIFVLLIRKKK